jgi:pyruvate kinase
MLSGETATGKYPLLAVRTMARIIEEIEASARFKSRFDAADLDLATSTNALAKSAVVAARQVGAHVIACVSHSGGAARLASEYRPEATIVAFTAEPAVRRRLALYWGVEPLPCPSASSFDGMIEAVAAELRRRGLGKAGDLAVLTLSVPLGSGASTNTLHLHKL